MQGETNRGNAAGRQPTSENRVVHGGWQKPVEPPKAESRPAGMPQVSAQPPASGASGPKEKNDG